MGKIHFRAPNAPTNPIEERVIRRGELDMRLVINRSHGHLRFMDFRVGNYEAKRDLLDQVARQEGLRKIFTLVEKQDSNGWRTMGFIREGVYPGFFRTADAFGAEGIVLCGFTPRPPHREIEKTALGATASVPWSVAHTALDAVRELQTKGYKVFAVEQTLEAKELPDLHGDPTDRIALVLGNELNGVSDPVVRACDGCVVVPQQGSKHSLNVSVCAGVVLWHCSRW